MDENIEAANTSLVMAYYDRLQNSDAEGMAAFLADDLDYWVYSPSPYSGHYSREKFLEILPGFFEMQASPLTFDFKAITSQNDRVCVYAWGGMPLKDGGYYGNIYHYLFRVLDGKIAEVVEVCAPIPAKPE